MTDDSSLYEHLFRRVVADDKLSARAGEFVLAAFEGEEPLRSAVGGGSPNATGTAADPPPRRTAPEVYLSSIRVQAFRGIGPATTLALRPGPGLTVVTGRNGSGKSSFAEATELALTGVTTRWSGKDNNAALWRQGWRNLHATGPTEIEVDLAVAGEEAPVTLRMSWPGDDLDQRSWTRQRRGDRREPTDAAWLPGTDVHRPFLSYDELGALLDSKPTELHDALHRLLGLRDLDVARDLLKAERRPYDARVKDVKERKTALLSELAGVADERARRARDLLSATKPDLTAIADLALGDDGDVRVVTQLRALVAVAAPESATVAAAAQALRDAVDQVAIAASEKAATAVAAGELLQGAIAHHDANGDGPCPVCGTGMLDSSWRTRAVDELDRLRRTAEELRAANRDREKAVREARSLVSRLPAALREAPPTVDTAAAVAAWNAWDEVGRIDDAATLAHALLSAHEPLVVALEHVRDAATAELSRLDEVWRPVAARLFAWHDDARVVVEEKPLVADLRQAEGWLRATADVLRDDRMAPIAADSQRIWAMMRQESSVDLGAIQLAGSGNQRKLVLDVTVDGSGASALGVMSQGELHALGLSLFLPRATATGSPFGFVMIDDPVQAMDPAKVDGLAHVLAEVARTRQVVVFSHDDRLADAVRRLPQPPTIWEVQRQEHSDVRLVPSADPVARYLGDARAVLHDRRMPEELRREVVATCCRGALEAAAHGKIRAARLARGERHAVVEDALQDADTTQKKVTLAVFDDPARGSDLYPRLNREGRWAADALRACKEGAHAGGYAGDLNRLVDDASRLAAWISR